MKEKIKINSLIKDTALSFFTKGIGAVASICFSICLSRNLGANGIGLYSLAVSIISYLVIISKFGLENTIIKNISIYERYGSTIKFIVIKSLYICGGISIILTLGICALSDYLSIYVFDKSHLALIIRIVSLSIFPITLTGIFCSVLKGIQKPLVALFFESCFTPIISILFLLIILFAYGNIDETLISINYIIVSVMSLLFIWIIWFNLKKKFNENKCDEFNYKNEVISMALPLLLVSTTNYLLTSTDILMLGMWYSEDIVGIYSVATKITMISSMLLIAINSVIGSKCAFLWRENRKEEMSEIIRKYSRGMLLFAIAFCIIICLVDEQLLMIFGYEFLSGKTILHITLLGQVFVLGTGPVATVLMMTGNEKALRNNTLICAICNIILNTLLIPHFGGIGAAIATSICLIIKNCYASYLVYKKVGISIY